MAQVGNDEVRNGEVLVQVGIVGSDYEYLGQFSEPPFVKGRGIAGTIVRVGPGCPQSLVVGGKVAVNPLNHCRRCSYCRERNYVECIGSRTRYVPGTPAILPVPLVTLLPEPLTLEEGALIQPLALACAVFEKADLRAEQGLVVFGASFIGIICCLLARSRGLREMMVVDTDQERLGLIREFIRFSGLGDNRDAVRTCVVAAGTGEVAGATAVVQAFGRKPDVCINATGDEELMKVAVKSVEDQGMYIHAKTKVSEVDWDVYRLYNENITIDEVGWEMMNFGDVVRSMILGGVVDLRRFCGM